MYQSHKSVIRIREAKFCLFAIPISMLSNFNFSQHAQMTNGINFCKIKLQSSFNLASCWFFHDQPVILIRIAANAIQILGFLGIFFGNSTRYDQFQGHFIRTQQVLNRSIKWTFLVLRNLIASTGLVS